VFFISKARDELLETLRYPAPLAVPKNKGAEVCNRNGRCVTQRVLSVKQEGST